MEQPFPVLIKSHIHVTASIDKVHTQDFQYKEVCVEIPYYRFGDTWHLNTGVNDSLGMSHWLKYIAEFKISNCEALLNVYMAYHNCMSMI